MTAEDQIRGNVEIKRLRESPLNPRKTYPEDELRGLAASMESLGVLQPLLVRPVPATAEFVAGEWVGLKHFEVVAGHRRFRAARLAKIAELPVTVRRISDADAKAVMLTENINREDLRPSEEAVTLAELVKGLGLEAVAEKVGKLASYVRERAALASLPAWFLAAVDAGLVPVSTATVVARVPGEESREKAAVSVALGHTGLGFADGWRDELFDESGEDGPTLRSGYTHVLTQRDAKHLVRTRFSRELKGAPFSRKSLDLVPEAGSCDACPKRAGNDEDLKAEGVRADTCTDPDCYEKKVVAYRAVEVLKAKSKHGAEPVDIDWPRHRSTPKGWCRLDMPVGDSEELNPDGEWSGEKAKQTVGALLATCGMAATPVGVTFHPLTGKATLLVKGKDARRTMERAGLMRKPEKEKRVPLGEEEVSLRPAKKTAGPKASYILMLNPDVMPDVQFEASEGAAAEELRERAVSAFMDWFDGVDWTDAKLVPRPFITFAPISVPLAPPPTVDTQGHPVFGDPSAWKDAFPDAPPVHAPGDLPLVKVEGLNAGDAQCLLAVGLRTLADLSAACGGDLDGVEEVLARWPGAFRQGDADRIATAVRRHLDFDLLPEVRTSAPLTAAAYNARVADLKASSADWFRDDKAREELAALWGGGCNSFGVFARATEETVARAGKAVVTVMLATGTCGLWLSSYSAEAGTSGSSSLPSITDTAYDTREAAREAAIRKALAWCGSHHAGGGVEKTKALAAKLADQLRAMLGETNADGGQAKSKKKSKTKA